MASPDDPFVAIRVPPGVRRQVQWLAAAEELSMYKLIEKLVRQEQARWQIEHEGDAAAVTAVPRRVTRKTGGKDGHDDRERSDSPG